MTLFYPLFWHLDFRHLSSKNPAESYDLHPWLRLILLYISFFRRKDFSELRFEILAFDLKNQILVYLEKINAVSEGLLQY